MTPPAERVESSSWHIIGRSTTRVYSNAWRITPPSLTGRPSSENAIAPASARSAISTRIRPAIATVTVASGNTRATPVAVAVRRMYSTTARLSTGGVVLAIEQMLVNPPRTAARVPVAIVSFSSWPGSRR